MMTTQVDSCSIDQLPDIALKHIGKCLALKDARNFFCISRRFALLLIDEMDKQRFEYVLIKNLHAAPLRQLEHKRREQQEGVEQFYGVGLRRYFRDYLKASDIELLAHKLKPIKSHSTAQSYLKAARETALFFLLETSQHVLCLQWRAYLDDEFLMSMHHQVATIPVNSINQLVHKNYFHVLLRRNLCMLSADQQRPMSKKLDLLNLVQQYPVLDAPIRLVMRESLSNHEPSLNDKVPFNHKECYDRFLDLMADVKQHGTGLSIQPKVRKLFRLSYEMMRWVEAELEHMHQSIDNPSDASGDLDGIKLSQKIAQFQLIWLIATLYRGPNQGGPTLLLHHCAGKGYLGIIRLLLKYGDASVMGDHGTALKIAEKAREGLSYFKVRGNPEPTSLLHQCASGSLSIISRLWKG